eukprot:31265-Pelagococcus_subviridis.AAC.18
MADDGHFPRVTTDDTAAATDTEAFLKVRDPPARSNVREQIRVVSALASTAGGGSVESARGEDGRGGKGRALARHFQGGDKDYSSRGLSGREV